MTRPLVQVRNLVKHFPIRRGLIPRPVAWVRAVDGVSFEIRRGETLSLVGESGCGKTTLGRTVLRLLNATAGEVRFDGESILGWSASRMWAIRRRMQIIFQDPYGSLNPRMNVETLVGEGLRVQGVAGRRRRRERVAKVLERVGLDPGDHLRRYPHEFSGGQRQRIGIARALVVEPEFIVCDEAVSALDASVQAQIINLLISLQQEEGYTYLFIAHDLSVVRHLSDRVAVMYLGRLVEIGRAADVYAAPHHPYTRALLAASPARHPSARGRVTQLGGEVPSPVAPPSGCRFHPRCPFALDRCRHESPTAVDLGEGHSSWCFLDSDP